MPATRGRGPRGLAAPFALALAALSASAADGAAQRPGALVFPTDLAAKVQREIAAKLDEDVAFALAKGEAIRVRFEPNPYDVAEMIVFADDLVWLDYGHGPTGKDPKKVAGALDQIGNAPCASILSWTPAADGLAFELRLCTDRAYLAPVLAAVSSRERRWSLWTRNGALDLPVELPEDERIAGFVRLWSEVKYNFALFDRVPELDWEKVLPDYLPRVRAASTASAYYRVLRECMALLRDGHSEVWGPDDSPTATLPLRLAEVEGKAIVVALCAAEAVRAPARRAELEQAKLARGDEVVAIDGEAIADVLARNIHPFLAASTPQHLAVKAFPLLGRGEPGSRAVLTVRSLQGGETRDVALTRGYLTATASETRPNDGELGDGIVFASIDTFGSESAVEDFEALLPKIRAARALVLDLRRNTGGSTTLANRVIGHLTDRPLPGARWRTRLYRPSFRAWGRPEGWHEGRHDAVKPAADPFLGPVVVLIGPRTFSAAEDFLGVVKSAKRATLVGSPTGGSTGQPLRIEGLPGGGGARVCTKRDTFPDGTEFVGIGVLPDVAVKPTRRDVADGRDVVLERGIAEAKRLAAMAR